MAANSEWRYKWIAGPLVAIIIACAGFAGSWFTVKANVGELRTDQSKIETKVDKHEAEINDIKVKNAEQSQIVKNVSDSLEKIEKQTSEIPQIRADLRVLKERSR